MIVSDAQRRAVRKYDKDKVDIIYLRVPKGQKDIIKEHASTHNESVNEFVARAIRETMERDSKR